MAYTRWKQEVKRGLFVAEDIGGPSDELLIAGLARGDMDCLGELYLRHGDNVLKFLRALLKDSTVSEVEDISHEVFLTVYEKAARYKENGTFRSWLFGITVRKARANQRKQRWRRRLLMDRARDEGPMPKGPQSRPDEVLERRQRIARGLARLTVDQREVVLLRAAEGLSGDEIAEALGITEDAVWSRLKRAGRILREETEGAW